MLNNPSFENTGWVANSSCTVAFDSSKKRSGSYSLKVTSTSSSESLIVTTDSYKITKDHIYYVRVYMYQDTASDVGAMQCYWPIAEPLMGTCNTSSSFVKKWQMMSWYNTRSNWSTGGNYQFRFDFESMASGKVAWIDDAMLIDLTECFGSGNEPDKIWCDLNVPYFKGTYLYGTKMSIKTSTWKDLQNGSILIPLIPIGYTPLEYIEGTGTQYINTQFIPTGNTRVLLDFETDTSDSQALFCGGRTAASGTDKQTFTAFYSVNNKKTIRRDYYGTSKTSTITYNPGRILFDANKNKTYINKNLDSVLSNYTLATSTASVMPIVLFTTCYQISSSAAITLSNSNWAKYKVYSCKIWDNNIIQRNLIPCKNSSGTLGLYDIINNMFYINAGTGTFTAGPIATTSWIKIGSL